MQSEKKLSLAGRQAKWLIRKTPGNSAVANKIGASLFLLLSLFNFVMGFLAKDPTKIVSACVFLVIAISIYQRSGFIELIEKEHLR